MKQLLILALLASAVFVGGCVRDTGEPQREPGTFLRPGGDVVRGELTNEYK